MGWMGYFMCPLLVQAATEAGGRLATNNNNNSITQPAEPEGGTHNHDNTTIHGSGSAMVDYMLTNPHLHPPPYQLINNNNGCQQQKQQALLLVDQDQPNSSSSINNNVGDKTLLSFADVMQFADFGPKLALNHHHRQNGNNNGDHQEDDTGIDDNDDDPVYFLKFPVLSNTHHMHMNMVPFPAAHHNDTHTPNGSQDGCFGDPNPDPDPLEDFRDRDQYGNGYNHHHHQQQIDAAAGVVLSTPTAGTSANNLINNYTNNPLQIEFLAGNNDDNLMGLSSSEKIRPVSMEGTATATAAGVGGTILMGHNNNNKSSSSSSKRKRPRSIKTNEEVESQRMTHIAVERNRRKQMNEHLRVLRSLMPSSYVQRGDQASIIGGAIEFVRELEQLLQCLESQKRRRLYGDQPLHAPSATTTTSTSTTTAVGLVQPQYPPMPMSMPMPMPMPMGSNQYHPQNPDDDQLRLLDHHLDPTPPPAGVGGGFLREETAESKSCFADVEVKVLGFDALIKILSRRRHGQLIKAIAAFEDLHFTILHTNITTIEQTVLYSFNVKVANEARFTAEDIATSVQQIFTFIHANTNII